MILTFVHKGSFFISTARGYLFYLGFNWERIKGRRFLGLGKAR